jgi:hypothetical protein
MCDHAILPPPAAPAPPALTWERTCPGSKDQAAAVRASLRSFLGNWPSTDDAITLASELVANAVCHSHSSQPGGQFTARAQLRPDGSLHVQVEDQGSDWDGDLSAAECPHGLYLLHALSAACGTRSGSGGWVTWFTLTAATTGQAGQA